MMRVFIFGLFIFTGITSEAQVSKHGPPCGGMDILAVGVHIKGQEILDYNNLRYSEINAEVLRNGFTLDLTDTSYKVSRFLIVHENSNGVKEYSISGAKVTAKKAAFIKSIKPGDQLAIECINIFKGGFTSLSTNFRVIVTK
jgi:hypothetical protein